MLKYLAQSPYLNFFSGIILFLTSGYETWKSFGEEAIGAHHGILIFSLVHIAKVVPEITQGLKEIEEADEMI
ncbi:MAG: hypothetical protein KZQ93_14900 [Candidatus Thiodiazotropha sp. (ex Monitilora ramsayi)]|nr:hypothetical protein [Candidatus Thiodiazotropha sp. (ex Monitilora ramsayi)]